MRLAAYGDVAYVNEELMEYTVRGDSDSSRRASRNRAVGDPLTPMGLALLSGMRAHQERRDVSHEEEQRVNAAVARFQLQRAIQHRYLKGGLGRWRGTAPDILRAVTYSPRTVLRPQGLLQALAAMVLPTDPLQRVRKTLMARRYAYTR